MMRTRKEELSFLMQGTCRHKPIWLLAYGVLDSRYPKLQLDPLRKGGLYLQYYHYQGDTGLTGYLACVDLMHDLRRVLSFQVSIH